MNFTLPFFDYLVSTFNSSSSSSVELQNYITILTIVVVVADSRG